MRLPDKLFGKRHVQGWPRGVRPVAPWIAHVKTNHPEAWEATKDLPASEGLRRLREMGAL